MRVRFPAREMRQPALFSTSALALFGQSSEKSPRDRIYFELESTYFYRTLRTFFLSFFFSVALTAQRLHGRVCKRVLSPLSESPRNYELRMVKGHYPLLLFIIRLNSFSN